MSDILYTLFYRPTLSYTHTHMYIYVYDIYTHIYPICDSFYCHNNVALNILVNAHFRGVISCLPDKKVIELMGYKETIFFMPS